LLLPADQSVDVDFIIVTTFSRFDVAVQPAVGHQPCPSFSLDVIYWTTAGGVGIP
jgi:hypothetical protein